METVETSDLFKAAFFSAKGADLTKIRFHGNGRRIAFFLFHGKGVTRMDSDYRTGRGLVNPLQYKESLNHLRDILFERLRQDDRGKRYDRKPKRRQTCFY